MIIQRVVLAMFLFKSLFCFTQNEKEFIIKNIESDINIDGLEMKRMGFSRMAIRILVVETK